MYSEVGSAVGQTESPQPRHEVPSQDPVRYSQSSAFLRSGIASSDFLDSGSVSLGAVATASPGREARQDSRAWPAWGVALGGGRRRGNTTKRPTNDDDPPPLFSARGSTCGDILFGWGNAANGCSPPVGQIPAPPLQEVSVELSPRGDYNELRDMAKEPIVAGSSLARGINVPVLLSRNSPNNQYTTGMATMSFLPQLQVGATVSSSDVGSTGGIGQSDDWDTRPRGIGQLYWSGSDEARGYNSNQDKKVVEQSVVLDEGCRLGSSKSSKVGSDSHAALGLGASSGAEAKSFVLPVSGVPLIQHYGLALNDDGLYRDGDTGGTDRTYLGAQLEERQGGVSHTSSATPLVPLHAAWPGNNVFLCNGLLMTGPEPCHLVTTCFLILGPSYLFCTRLLPMVFRSFVSISVASSPILVLVTSSIFCLFRSACTEPGIIPRQQPSPLTDPEGEERESREICLNGVVVTLKWCRTCRIYRPPRAKHCVMCDNCVQRFDHHCPWVSNCIGLRNYRYFFAFVVSLSALVTYIFFFAVFTLTHLIRRQELFPAAGALAASAHQHQSDSTLHSDTAQTAHPSSFSLFFSILGAQPALLVMLLLSGCLFCPLANLCIFHCYLITRNLTTNEEMKDIYRDRLNPFSLGVMNNFHEILCSDPQPESLVAWDQLVERPIIVNRTSSE